MDALKEDLKAVDKKIQQLINNDLQFKQLFDTVDSVKGIGPVIATEVLITTNEFKDITDPKKYACYSGFAPFERSSGKYKGKSKVSNKANKKVKALLHNGAMSAIQDCKELKEYYQRKVGEGKNEMLVINNVCNKLVHCIFACVSQREKYNENYIQSFAWITEIGPSRQWNCFDETVKDTGLCQEHIAEILVFLTVSFVDKT